MAEKDTKLSWQLLAFLLLVVAAEAVHWLITPAAHPGAPPLQTVLVVLQAALASGAAFWCWHHGTHTEAH